MNPDRYEWDRISCSIAAKEIYIRDIYKSWYVTGINSCIDTIDKLADFLKDEVKDMPVICIGSSSGGYLAALLGVLLNADHVVAFSAQFELRNKGALDAKPFLRRYQNVPERAKYYDIKPFLERSDVPIYYLVPIKNEQDHYHYEYIKNVSCIRPIVFKSKHHGVIVPKGNLSGLLSMTASEWDLYYQRYRHKQVSPVIFSMRYEGAVKTGKDLWRTASKTVLKKIGKS